MCGNLERRIQNIPSFTADHAQFVDQRNRSQKDNNFRGRALRGNLSGLLFLLSKCCTSCGQNAPVDLELDSVIVV